MLSVGLPRIAVTRIYFAVFHAVRAMLYVNNLEPRTHQGVQHLFNVHFVRAGTFTSADGALLARLQKYREEADYAEGFVPDERLARAELVAGSELIKKLRERVAAAS